LILANIKLELAQTSHHGAQISHGKAQITSNQPKTSLKQLRKISKKLSQMPWKEAQISCHKGCIPSQNSRCHEIFLWMYNSTMKRNQP
jgi:hypothetical protein